MVRDEIVEEIRAVPRTIEGECGNDPGKSRLGLPMPHKSSGTYVIMVLGLTPGDNLPPWHKVQ